MAPLHIDVHRQLGARRSRPRPSRVLDRRPASVAPRKGYPSFGRPRRLGGTGWRELGDRGGPSWSMVPLSQLRHRSLHSVLRADACLTGREKLKSSSGLLHGHGRHVPGQCRLRPFATLGLPDSPGVPRSTSRQPPSPPPYNDLEALKALLRKIRRNRGVIPGAVVGQCGLHRAEPGLPLGRACAELTRRTTAPLLHFR